MSASIVGSWYVANPGGGTDQIVFSFLSNGRFLVADMGSHDRDPSGQSGLEAGTYTWNANTGAISFNFTVNTDGEWGLSHSGITNATVDGNTLTFHGAEGEFSIPRLTTVPGAIVGSWTISPKPGFSMVFTLLADGHYMLSDGADPAHDLNGTPGIEWGTYTWNPDTGAFAATTLVNTDGQWGFSSHAPDGVNRLVVDGDSLEMFAPSGLLGTASRLSPVPVLTGGSSDDLLFGSGSGETFTGFAGNDTVNGGGGIDTLDFSGPRANYTITATQTGFSVHDNVGTDGTDTLTGVERLHFTDENTALDLNGNAGFTAKLLGAVFGSEAIAEHPDYMGIGIYLLDIGLSQTALAQKALNVVLPGATSTELVTLLYDNLFGTPPPADELALFVGLLDGGLSQASLVVIAANSTFNQANIDLVGLTQTGVEYQPFG
jgi:hypothetical protein